MNVGATTTVDLVISGAGDGVAPSLGEFDVDVSFDPSIPGFSGAALGNQLDLSVLGSIQLLDATVVDAVTVAEVSLESPSELDTMQAGSFCSQASHSLPWKSGAVL